MNTDVDYYDILQCEPGSSMDELKVQYRRLTELYHPSRNPNDRAYAEGELKKVQDAFLFLSDPTRKARYDQIRRQKFGDHSYHALKAVQTSPANSSRLSLSSIQEQVRQKPSSKTKATPKKIKKEWAMGGAAALALIVIVLCVTLSHKKSAPFMMTDSQLARLIAKQHPKPKVIVAPKKPVVTVKKGSS